MQAYYMGEPISGDNVWSSTVYLTAYAIYHENLAIIVLAITITLLIRRTRWVRKEANIL
jgi:hypothetical protein